MEDIVKGQDGVYHYFYKITNTVNGKVYYGIHSTNNLNDGYLGSGSHLARAKQKYGKDVFCKEILKCFGSREELSQYEKTFVSSDFLMEMKDRCYNVKEGGDESSPGVRMFKGAEEIFVSKELIQEKRQEGFVTGIWISSGSCATIYNPNLEIPEGWQRGRSEDVRAKLQYNNKGRKFITDGIVQKMMPKGEEMPEGWRYGMSDCTRADRKGRPAYNLGKVRITDGVHEKHISVGDEIPEGWYKGLSEKSKDLKSRAHKGRIVITDGIHQRRIYNSDDIPEGWTEGLSQEVLKQRKSLVEREQFRTRGKKRITNGIHVLYVLESEIPGYISNGWVQGYTEEQRAVLRARKKSPGTTGKIHITDGKHNHAIDPKDLEQWESKGFHRGRTLGSH